MILLYVSSSLGSITFFSRTRKGVRYLLLKRLNLSRGRQERVRRGYMIEYERMERLGEGIEW